MRGGRTSVGERGLTCEGVCVYRLRERRVSQFQTRAAATPSGGGYNAGLAVTWPTAPPASPL